MTYIEGKLVWGILFILVACVVEFGVRRYLSLTGSDISIGSTRERVNL